MVRRLAAPTALDVSANRKVPETRVIRFGLGSRAVPGPENPLGVHDETIIDIAETGSRP